ncbi:MAG: 50S ribosomal protein L18Ae [archaeon]
MKQAKSKKEFTVIGKFTQNGRERKFSKAVSCQNAAQARERAMQLFGSKNGIKRRNIIIGEVKEV